MATSLENLAGTKALGDVRQLASQARAHSAPAADGIASTQAQIDKLLRLTQGSASELQDAINAITSLTVADIIAAGFRKVSVASATLTAATTNLTHAAPENEGDVLFYKVFQDGTGGRKITWDTNLLNATVQLGVDLPNTRYLFVFVGLNLSGLKWVSFLLPVLDF